MMSEIVVVKDKIWDSNFFNLRIGYTEVAGSFPITFKVAPFDLIYVFSKEPISHLEQYLMDVKMLLVLNLDNSTRFSFTSSFLLKEFNINEDNYQDLEALAIASGGLSRFKRDGKLGFDAFQKLYKKWIENIVSSGDDVLILKDGIKILGFVSINFDYQFKIATIGLFAINEHYRGKGLGKLLMSGAIQTSNKKGMKKLYVATQQINTGAMKLYERSGFETIEKTYVYHLWKV